ncbi:S41 family peptidase [Hydrocarboniclastica marina]|nr:S41 family peptidase [Hydrocarboniclastica marina]
MTVSSIRSLAPYALIMALAFSGTSLAEELAPDSSPVVDPDAPAERILPIPEGTLEDTENVDKTAQDAAGELPLEQLRRFVAIFDRIKRAYVEDVSDSELLDHAINGMLSGLDPHSAYLKSDEFHDLEESTSGRFGGLGIEVGMEDGFVKVIAPIDDTPASRAGIQPGDLIVKLDGETVKGMSLEEAVGKMRGAPGTTITMTIVRDGESAPIEIEVERDVVKVTSIKSRMLDQGFGYIRITQFQATSGPDFRDAIQRLQKHADGPLRGLVIDLRNNPGGVLQASVEIADALIDDGLLVYTEGRVDASKLEFRAEPGDLTQGIPIVVLINGGSASASEILAGALQDHKRGVIMGTESFGKGSVQTVMPLDGETAIKLTTARYFTPSGRSIQALGIEPDIEVKSAKITETQNQPFFSEAELSGHLTNGSSEADSETKDKKKEGKKPAQKKADSKDSETDEQQSEPSLVDQDYQLRSALNLLKGLAIMHRTDTPEPAFDGPEDNRKQ